MLRKVKRILIEFMRMIGFGVTRYSTLEKLRRNSSAACDIELLKRLNSSNAENLLKYISKSKSQLRQDLFVLSHYEFKSGGYFVEFGAANGLDLSNTYLMEKEFGWKGILAEPAITWHKDLTSNRECNIETKCVWKDSKSILTFNQVDVAELSTISEYSSSDAHKNMRKKGKYYDVQTISLNDLLNKHNAPKDIDYLSIDTEGSEYEILSNFDFSEYTIGVITCEHNYTQTRDKLFLLLTTQGYRRVFQDLSLFDDWYVKIT